MKGSLVAPRPMRRAGIYGVWEQLDRELASFFEARVDAPERLGRLKTRIRMRAAACHLTEDVPEGEDFDEYVSRLYKRVVDLKNLPVRAGLPDRQLAGEALTAYIVSRVRFAGEAPSFLRLLAREIGYEYEELLEESSRTNGKGLTLGVTLEKLEERMFWAVDTLRRSGFSGEIADDLASRPWAQAFSPAGRAELTRIFHYITDTLVPGLTVSSTERHVGPGQTAAFLPSPWGWEIGRRLGDALIYRYIHDEGRYPEAVAIVLWEEADCRSQGQSVAEFLYLMGIRPLWDKAGQVSRLEPIPLRELKRPRIDVTGCISSRFRTGMGPVVELLGRAVRMAGELSEDDADNYVARHMMADVKWLRAQGVDEAEALARAAERVFPEPPASGEIRHLPALLQRAIPKFDAVIKNEDNRATHMFCSEVYNACQGSLVAAGAQMTGRLPRAYVGDSSDPGRVQVREVREEARRLFWGEAMNPRFLEDMRSYGEAGAYELAHYLERACQWDISCGILEDWMYEMFARRYVLNKDSRQWMNQAAPGALHMAAKLLLQAIGQGRWTARARMAGELERLEAELPPGEETVRRA